MKAFAYRALTRAVRRSLMFAEAFVGSTNLNPDPPAGAMSRFRIIANPQAPTQTCVRDAVR
jgi:hypothetical protein